MPSLSTLGYMIENEPPNEQTLLSQCWEEKAFLAEKQHSKTLLYVSIHSVFCNTIQTGIFFGLLRSGRRGWIFPPVRSYDHIKVITTKLGGYILRLKISPLRSAWWSYDVTWRNDCIIMSEWQRPCWSAIFDFQIFPKLQKSLQHWLKSI